MRSITWSPWRDKALCSLTCYAFSGCCNTGVQSSLHPNQEALLPFYDIAHKDFQLEFKGLTLQRLGLDNLVLDI